MQIPLRLTGYRFMFRFVFDDGNMITGSAVVWPNISKRDRRL